MLFPSATRKGKDMQGCLGVLVFFFALGVFVEAMTWLSANVELPLETIVIATAAMYGSALAALVYSRSFKRVSKKRTRSK